MNKLSISNRFKNILFWSIISAAFIGPGTVTTAAAAGAGFGYSLIWALVFSIIACFILQEASARITIISGRNLGQVLRDEYSGSVAGKILVWLTLTAIILGCLAFEAGNILGSVAGIRLVNNSIPNYILVSLIGLIAFLVLFKGTIHQIARILGVVVAIMGFSFVLVAISIRHDISEIVMGGLIPVIPYGAELIVLGLIGTTVVPYNIFLGSGIRHTQSLMEMRISMAIAILLGGFISISILLSATIIQGEFSFDSLAGALQDKYGIFARLLLAVGLFGAGFSSAVTAALAAAITARSILGKSLISKEWGRDSLKFRIVWIFILLTGVFFGLLNLQPVPIIILAQAMNGIILPVIAFVLFKLLNNNNVIPKEKQSGKVLQYLTGLVVYLTFLAGISNILRALSRAEILEMPALVYVIVISAFLFSLAMISSLIKKSSR